MCGFMGFISKHLTQTDSDLFSNSVIGMCGKSLLISNMTPPPSRVLSFLYKRYVKVSGNNSELEIELSIYINFAWVCFVFVS